MSNLLQHVGQSIVEQRLFRNGQKILVAVSGGVDSMVLLHLLARLSKKHGWRLTVVHFNHQLRGRSSDADEGFVREAARKLDVRFVAGRADVRRHARRHKLSIEMAARKLRHEFLARTALRLKIPAVALAHHADDQVELFFVRLLRGAGGGGLGGMKWRSPSPADAKLELVRPLLDQSKAALLDFARREQIAFRQDASNASADILRNRIRIVLLPWLRKQFRSPVAKTIPRLMEIVSSEADCVAEAARRWLQSKRRTPFARLPVAIQRRCIQLQLVGQGIAADFDLVERLRLKPAKPASVRSRVAVQRDNAGKVRVTRTEEKAVARRHFSGKSMRVDLCGRAGEVTFSGNRICWKIAPNRGLLRRAWRKAGEFFDADRVGARIFLRHWLAGDRFQPIGMDTPVKLQDFLTNQKVPRELRHRLVVAATRSGEIFWVEGLRIGERFKLDNGTRRRLKWTWQRV